MGLPINIRDLIEGRIVENTRIEYKSDWDPEPIVHSITAFANDFDNTGGGYVFHHTLEAILKTLFQSAIILLAWMA